MKRHFEFILSVLMVLNTVPWRDAAAEIQNGEDLLFLNIPTVVSASKMNEAVTDAPSSVTSWSAKDIRSMGYYTLSDLANVTPGYSAYTIYGEKVFETRGQKAGSFNNNKHLLFVDGIPVNHARNYKANTEEELPLYFAKNVEFLRGPASALYGVSAFYGVVSVNPQDLDSNGTLFEQKVSMGNNDNNRRFMSNYLHRSDDGNSKLSMGYFQKDASKAFTGPFNDENNHFWDDQKSLFLYGSHQFDSGALRGFTPGVIVMTKEGGLGEHWNGVHGGSSEMNDLTWDQIIPYLKFKKNLGKVGEFNSYLKGNKSMERGVYADLTDPRGFGNYESNVLDVEGLAELQTPLMESLSWINGVNYDNRKEKLSSNDHPSPDYAGNVETYSGYSQLRQIFPLLKGTIVTLGARYDMGKASRPGSRYTKVSPRAGVVQKLTDRWSLRLSHGEAIRAPGIKEYGLNGESQPFIIYNLPDLKPETIKSDEAGISYNNRRLLASLTAFQNRTANPLDGTQVGPAFNTDGGTRNIFVNGNGKVETEGVEVESRYSPFGRLDILFNASYARAEDQDGNPVDGNDPIDIPTAKVNSGVGYTFKSIGLQTMVIDRWVKSYVIPDSRDFSGYNVVDTNFIKTVSDRVSFELQVRNVFDRDYKLPKGGVADIPMPGRSATASVNIQF